MARSLSCIPYRPVVGPPERAWIENALFFCVFLPSPAREAAASRAMKIENIKGPKPFLKWVGGKTQLLPELMARLPHDFSTTVKVYAEPFVGGGAYFSICFQKVCTRSGSSSTTLIPNWPMFGALSRFSPTTLSNRLQDLKRIIWHFLAKTRSARSIWASGPHLTQGG